MSADDLLADLLGRAPDLQERTLMDHFIGVFRYAGMPIDEAERSMQLFANDVLPELKKLPPRS